MKCRISAILQGKIISRDELDNIGIFVLTIFLFLTRNYHMLCIVRPLYHKSNICQVSYFKPFFGVIHSSLAHKLIPLTNVNKKQRLSPVFACMLKY